MRQFTFPANKASPGFTLDLDLNRYCLENEILALNTDSDGTLVLWRRYNHSVNYLLGQSQVQTFPVLGMHRTPFPACCGVDIVWYMNHHLTARWPQEICEKWWQWVSGIVPRVKPAIGIVAKLQNSDNTIGGHIDGEYHWIISKGVQMGQPFKNIRYPNHVLVPYLFFPGEGIDQVVNPRYGMIT